jgi:C4-dicarboxylate-specific signal transduction histidine kinase
VTRTATIIRRLRDFTKPSDVKLEKLYVNDLVRESLEILAFETRRAHLYPEMLLASDLPWVQGDRIQLQQIIVSLITNACEAVADVPVQQRKLTIRSGVDGKMIRIEFEDSGTGISADALESVFDAFVTSRSGGTGMGLTVSRTIAEAHRGILYAKSNAPAPGACFVLELPYPGARAASQSVASGPAELNEDRKSE